MSAVDLFPPTDRAREFLAAARQILAASTEWERLEQAATNFERTAPTASRVLKAAAHGLADEVWQSGDAKRLAEGFIASIAPRSVLDSIAPHAVTIPWEMSEVMTATGFVADPTAESFPRVVKRADLDLLTGVDPTTVAAITVMTSQLARTGGAPVQRLFERELTSAVLRGMNSTVLAMLTIGETLPASADEFAPAQALVTDLKALLAASADSDAYTIATTPAVCRQLAIASDGRMSVRGGQYTEGVNIVPAIEPSSGNPQMIAIPASRCAYSDGGLIVRSALHADVNMADSPTAPSEVVSLFATGSVGLLVERMFRLACADEVVAVG